MEHAFVALPGDYEESRLFDDNGKAFRQVLWGDWLWNVKTDGQWLIAAFKKESASETDKWFYLEYRVVDGKLPLVDR